MSQASDSWVLRQDEIGPVKLGMVLGQLNAISAREVRHAGEQARNGLAFALPLHPPPYL
jgi:hypothetical protein